MSAAVAWLPSPENPVWLRLPAKIEIYPFGVILRTYPPHVPAT